MNIVKPRAMPCTLGDIPFATMSYTKMPLKKQFNQNVFYVLRLCLPLFIHKLSSLPSCFRGFPFLCERHKDVDGVSQIYFYANADISPSKPNPNPC